MFNTLNAQQQPFIQGGYGALGKLNTLLGLGSRPMPMPMGGGQQSPGAPPMGGPNWRPTPGGGVQQMVSMRPQPISNVAPDAAPGGGNLRLRQILALRAQNGDSEAARILGAV